MRAIYRLRNAQILEARRAGETFTSIGRRANLSAGQVSTICGQVEAELELERTRHRLHPRAHLARLVEPAEDRDIIRGRWQHFVVWPQMRHPARLKARRVREQ